MLASVSSGGGGFVPIAWDLIVCVALTPQSGLSSLRLGWLMAEGSKAQG